MEYFIGPLVALVIGIKYTDFKNKLNTSKVQALQEDVVARIEKMEVNVADVDKEILKKSLKIILPIAQATERLQEAVGVK